MANYYIKPSDEVEVIASSSYSAVLYDADRNIVIVAYHDTADSNKGKIRVGTITNNTVTLGTASTFTTAAVDLGSISLIKDPVQGVYVVSFGDTAGTKGYILGFTISGTTPSYGSPVEIQNARTFYIHMSYNASKNLTVVDYMHGVANTSHARTFTLSGTVPTLNAAVTLVGGNVANTGQTAYDSLNDIYLHIHSKGSTDYDVQYTSFTVASNGVITVGTNGVSFNGGTNTPASATCYDPINDKLLQIVFNNSVPQWRLGVKSTGTSYNWSDLTDYFSTSLPAGIYYIPTVGKLVSTWQVYNTIYMNLIDYSGSAYSPVGNASAFLGTSFLSGTQTSVTSNLKFATLYANGTALKLRVGEFVEMGATATRMDRRIVSNTYNRTKRLKFNG